MPKWLKVILKIVGAVVLLFLLLSVGLFIYINSNKAKVLTLITSTLNKNLTGKLTIGDMETTFFKGFPGISVSLKNVLVKDSRWAEHHHTLLTAKDFDVSINTAALLRGAIRISNIEISNAAIDLYKDSTGYSNSSIFKKKDKTPAKPDDDSGSSAEFGKFTLNKVTFAVNNQKNSKLFQFDINKLAGKMTYPDSGWHADLQMDVTAKSMAFNTNKGSFIKNKHLTGQMLAGFNEDNGKINILSKDFSIGGNPFVIGANFNTAKKGTDFDIHIAANQILWRNAAGLVAANISKTLNKFNLSKPIDITTLIQGNLGGGDPLIYATGKIRDNKLTIPGAVIDSCNFDAVFTNNNVKGKGFVDANSAIRLSRFTGRYNHLPFVIDTGSIVNLEKPIATGNFKSTFPLVNLNYTLGADIAKFTKGQADMNLHYRADVVDYKLNKPVIAGIISFKNADFKYLPRNLALINTSLSLNFVGNDLVLKDTRLQSGRSVITMQGRVNNFLNLYYSAPEKILLTWQIKSPELRLGEFLGFLNSRQQVKTSAATPANSGNVIDQLSNVLEKGNAEMHMDVAKVYYKKFLATNVKADLLTTSNGIIIKNVGLKHAGGGLQLNGKLMQGKFLNTFAVNTTVSNVNIREFFYAFDNFGLHDITSENLKGFLSAKTQITGGITDQGSLVPRSVHGTAAINLKNGALINYDPLIKVGKFAFPFRDLKNIEIPKLDASFNLEGDKILINPMQINSSVLNVDVAGTYAFTRGTNISFDVPLRNPKKDEDITDKQELQKRRMRGIVLHLAAKDDGTGKVKIGWNKDHK
ncbi:AsmA family protein [Mucilaginibacter galii]|uniref:AsmA domain-containing protein n=1 Tax=Mucilaginibacter galii TaxID=2005073 RepID=A0A917J6N9_9SPHI|nr:AsmA family protein [Mucilaginibacter galii]GGI50063.1 hypothetical protein GCM10011425_12750 [Mucilaginibacter galii]